MPNPFRVVTIFLKFISQGCRCAPTTGLELANAFGVFAQIQTDALPFFRKACLVIQPKLK
jgi:hypothetical protein